MSKKARLLCLLLAFLPAFLLTLGACSRPQPAEIRSSLKIGVAVYDQYDTFVGEMMRHFTDEVRALEQETGLKITVLRKNADGSQEAQNNQVESLIKAGCDVLCVNIVDRMDAAMIIDRAEAAQIPIIFFNRELVEEDLERNDMLFYVGADAVQCGVLQGELVAQLCGLPEDAAGVDPEVFARVDKNGDGILQYVMLEGEADHQDALVRTKNSIQTLMNAGFRLERLESEVANWVRTQAETKMQEWLRVHGDAIEVVLANNDDMALGAIDAMKRAQVPAEQWPIVVGTDGTPVGLDAIVAGEMAGTVYNDAHGQALCMLQLAYALFAGEPLPALKAGKYIHLPYKKILPENVEDFLQ